MILQLVDEAGHLWIVPSLNSILLPEHTHAARHRQAGGRAVARDHHRANARFATGQRGAAAEA